ncbi:MAG: glycosyltransferase family 2 protein [Promethearchaeota archaeon]
MKTKLSIVIPTYNEEKNVVLLYRAIKEVLDKITKNYEIIYVDDGSRDRTFLNLKELHERDKRVKVIKFRRNFGQTAAMDAGFKFASSDIIIGMDADLQNDPRDIPRLIAKINEGYDCVSGWRVNRRDSFSKKIFSKFANFLRHTLIHDKIHDSGCSLKAYRKECFDNLDLYGEMHRFIPALLKIQGFRIGEIKVRHHSRKHGKTKYTMKRVLKGFIDLLNVWFWQKFSSRPLHLFGGMGIIMNLLGTIVGLYLLIMKFFYGQGIANRPLLLLAVLLVILGIQFLVFGVLADMIIKLYYQENKNYNIKEILK